MSESNESGGQPGGGGQRRYARRLSDKVLNAFHQACDQSDYEAAQQLLNIVEQLIERAPGNRRKNLDGLVAAHERLWHIRNQR